MVWMWTKSVQQLYIDGKAVNQHYWLAFYLFMISARQKSIYEKKNCETGLILVRNDSIGNSICLFWSYNPI